MTREELAAALARVKKASSERFMIVRVVVDAHGRALKKIFRGYFVSQDANARRPEG
jgi:hypothetical protein